MKTLFAILRSRRRERLDPLLSNFQEFIREEGGGGILLLLAALAALLWANSAWHETYETLWSTPFSIGLGDSSLTKPLHFWINDGLMAIFFFVVGLEIKREFLAGELSKPRQALFPILAALGGMLVPAIIYTAINYGGPGAAGWAIPVATDIAFALGVLSLLGKRAPFALKVFLTAVAIVDDIGAVLVIALFYSHDLVWSSLLMAGILLIVLFMLNRFSVRSPLPYVLLGICLWLAVLQSGVHATIAGILLAATIPANPRVNSENFLRRSRNYLQRFEEAGEPGRNILTNGAQRSAIRALEEVAERASSPLQRLEHSLHPWVAYAIMPTFALANAGVSLSGQSLGLLQPIGLGVFLGLVVGKQVGITLFAWLFTRLGVASRPRGLRWGHIYGVAWLAGIGFTMSIFITSLALNDGFQVTSSKLAIMTASLVSAIGGVVVLYMMSRITRRTD
ncbi:MAG: Na+/H+ antiporter NhaA [Anaerolineales bacterium]